MDSTVQKSLSSFQLLLIFSAGIFLVIINMDSMWSYSVDLAHHYALAFRISENWTLPVTSDPTLGEMNFYPRASHTLAAVIGLFFNSTFLGIQLISLMALALLWGAVIFILNTLPLRVAYISSIGLMCLLAANREYLNFEVHGSELIGNFFFSQLVAQSVVIFVMATAIYLEIKKHKEYAIIFFLIVATFIATGIHLLPALELLGVFCGIIVINNYMLSGKIRHQRLKMRLWYLAAITTAIVSVFLNPAFTAMRKISENNGGLLLTHISNIIELILVCLLVLAISGLLLILWNKNRDNPGYIAIKYLGLYGGSIALLCLAQIAVLKFGYGSEYATKKYAFGLFTHLFISISVLAGLFLENSLNIFFGDALKKAVHRSIIVLLTYSSAFLFSIPQAKTLDTSNVVSLERQLIALRDVALPEPASTIKNNVVIGLADMPMTINYMFSIAIMKTPRSIAKSDLLVSNQLDISNYNTILTSVGFKPYYSSNCKHPLSSGSVALLDAACVGEALINSNLCTGNVDFSSNGFIDRSSISGFSRSDVHGRWTDGRNAKFTCIIKEKTPSRVKIHVTPFLYGSHDSQRLVVTIESSKNEYVFNNTSEGRSIEIALPDSKGGEKMTIDFYVPDAISPKQLGLNDDRRLLGVSIKSISFE